MICEEWKTEFEHRRSLHKKMVSCVKASSRINLSLQGASHKGRLRGLIGRMKLPFWKIRSFQGKKKKNPTH